MFNFKKIDLSYKSMTRYIIDLNLFIGFVILVTYKFESIQEYEATKSVVYILMMIIGAILLQRMIKFSVENTLKCSSIDTEILLDEDTQKLLTQYACNNNINKNDVVILALSEYIKSDKTK